MQDQPSPHELLEGVIRFLRDTALPRLDERAAYDARIAASLLKTVQRQLVHCTEDTSAERTRLQLLLGSPRDDLDGLRRALCEQIRTGAIAWDSPALLDHLWAVTLDKLAVDQPGYSTYQRVRARLVGANSSDTTIGPARTPT
jgi:hypothetical protein